MSYAEFLVLAAVVAVVAWSLFRLGVWIGDHT
jgi:hypothetical protein